MYKIKLYLIFIFFTMISLVSEAKIPVTIIKIKDGDTIDVKLQNNNSFPVRLIGIDCFETSKIHRSYKQAYTNNLSIDKVVEKGVFNKQFLEELYKNSNQQVFLEFMGLDTYKRVLGIIIPEIKLGAKEFLKKHVGKTLVY